MENCAENSRDRLRIARVRETAFKGARVWNPNRQARSESHTEQGTVDRETRSGSC